ncbi:MAG: substrate-binding domain-containing protein [Rhodospirillales bacterium]|nr:substrate-binding domain-containing protein [Rhodospirillales bacterium]
MSDAPVSVLSSMATRGLLGALAEACAWPVVVESSGGVEVARRVRAGEAVDVVVLAATTMRQLAAEGIVDPGSLADLAVSSMVVAVREGTPFPDLGTEAAVRAAVLAAPRTGYSTGPSGQHLLHLIERWGIGSQLGGRLVQAPPGVPVGRLLTEGKVDLAMQQRSELMHLAGVAIVGPLPPPVAADTVFTAGIARAARQVEAARRVIAFMASPATGEAKRRHGLRPADGRDEGAAAGRASPPRTGG